MSYWKIAWRSIEQRALASSLTGLSMALGVAVMVCVIVIHSVAVRQFKQDAQGYHLIVGGKGGALQLVLSTVYHVGQPLYPIPYDYYEQFVNGRYAKWTEVAVPYCLGDSFDPTPEEPGGRLYRVVGTTRDLFDKIAYRTNPDGSLQFYEFASGRSFETDHAYEAVVGSVVAAQTGLKVGDEINPTHGISDSGDRHDAFTVVGVLDSTGTANDRAVFINIEGFNLLEGHSLSDAQVKSRGGGEESGGAFDPLWQLADVLRGAVAPSGSTTSGATLDESYSGEPRGIGPPEKLYDSEGHEIELLPTEKREVTSILVLCPTSGFGDFMANSVSDAINKDPNSIAKAVAPSGVISSLLDQIVGPVQIILLVLTVLIVIVASVSILVSIYNSMSERSHDIAVMRALGASRVAVMMITLFESILLAVVGGVVGILLGHALIAAATPYVEMHTGVRLAFWDFDPNELIVIPALVVLASVVGLLPAMAAYRTDVAKSLSGMR